MTDLLEEVKRDMSEEKYARIFVEHGNKLLAAGIIIVVLAAVHYFYTRSQDQKSMAVGSRLMSAMNDPKPENFNDIIANENKGFTPLAVLMKAGAEDNDEKYDQAIKTLDNISNNSKYDKAFRQIAMIDQAYLMIRNKEPKEKILPLLDKVTGSDAVFKGTALQLKGSYLLQIGEKDEAVKIFSQLAADETIPATTQERAKHVLATIH